MANPVSSAEARPDRVAVGASLIVLAVFLMSLQDAIIKYASSAMPLWQIYVLRGLLAVPTLVALAALTRSFRLRVSGWIWLRSVLLVLMYLCIYAAVPVTSLSVVAAGFYTGPLFITALGALLIGEPVGRRRWSAILVGFLGVLVILRPGGEAFSFVAMLPVLAGLFYALAALVTRARCRHESSTVMAIALNLALLLTGLAASLALILWHPETAQVVLYPFLLGPWVALGIAEWAYVAILAVLIVGIGLGLAAAYQSAPPVVVATFDYSYLVFAAVWSYVLFDEPPDAPTAAGMLMIAGAGLLVTRAKKPR